MLTYKVIVNQNKTKWFLNEKLHREDGPAIEYIDGTNAWYLNDKLHREDGPAIEYPDGNKYWFLNDQLHRTDGPAIVNANGAKIWYLNDKEVTESDVMNPTQELTMVELESLLGHKVKIIK